MKRKTIAAIAVALGMVAAPLTAAAANAATVEFPRCEGSTTLPVSTNLDGLGWIAEDYDDNPAEYVEGGLRFNFEGDSYAYFELPAPLRLSELESVGFDAAPDYGGMIFYNDDNSVNVHYEPVYSNPLWTTREGVLPEGGGGQGGPYSGDFGDLLSNPEVTAVSYFVNGGNDVTLRSLTFNCTTQPFALAQPEPSPTPTPDPTVTPVPPVDPPATLPATGGDDVNLIVPIVGGLLSVLGVGVFLMARRRHA